jgi:GNAT superfamily N-acetyltransferase
MTETSAAQRLAAAIYTVVAEDASSSSAIGCALLLGDGASFFYVKDVMVHPDWQRKKVGTSLMQHLIHWVENNAPEKSLIGLYTREGLESFYGQFGFAQSFGMIRYK